VASGKNQASGPRGTGRPARRGRASPGGGRTPGTRAHGQHDVVGKAGRPTPRTRMPNVVSNASEVLRVSRRYPRNGSMLRTIRARRPMGTKTPVSRGLSGSVRTRLSCRPCRGGRRDC
jgi:hypothetical protein